MQYQDTRFILLSTPRAGTHMIRSVLDQHPDVCCYGELFNHKRDEWYPECAGMDIVDVEQWISTQSRKLRIGFAIHLRGEGNEISEAYWNSASVDYRLRIIYVVRRNQLRQTLSQYRSRRARQLAGGGYMSYRQNSPDHSRFGWTADGLRSIGKLVVDCNKFWDDTLSREANEIAFFASHPFDRICGVAYEDFVDDPAAETKRITAFLDVKTHYFHAQTEKLCRSAELTH